MLRKLLSSGISSPGSRRNYINYKKNKKDLKGLIQKKKKKETEEIKVDSYKKNNLNKATESLRLKVCFKKCLFCQEIFKCV